MNPPAKKGTILIVDDEPNVLWFISKVCQPMGYETLTAGSGMEALKVVQECGEKIDLMLLDLRMPGMGGVEVLKSVRKHRPDLPVIVVTAVHDKQEECERLGIEAFVKKPYSLEDLYARIEKVIERENFEKGEAKIPAGMESFARILVVDDDREICELLSASLSEDFSDGFFDVKWVNSGEEALEISKTFKPDIAIVEIKLPTMWGDELIRKFKAGQGFCPKDFVIYSYVTDPEEVERAKKLGYKFLTKPTELDSLFEVLKKICARHNLLRKREA